jgi:hypothetical protein
MAFTSYIISLDYARKHSKARHVLTDKDDMLEGG